MISASKVFLLLQRSGIPCKSLGRRIDDDIDKMCNILRSLLDAARCRLRGLIGKM
jgi:hypothetical protein